MRVFLIARLVTSCLVADPHRPRTIIRTRIIAAVRINQSIGGETEHGGEPNRFPGRLASTFCAYATYRRNPPLSFLCNEPVRDFRIGKCLSGNDQQALNQCLIQPRKRFQISNGDVFVHLVDAGVNRPYFDALGAQGRDEARVGRAAGGALFRR